MFPECDTRPIVAIRSAKVAAPSWTQSLAALTLAMCVAVTSPAQDKIRLADDAPGPLPVEESQKLFQVQPGFRVEIVASEPHLADPVAMASTRGDASSSVKSTVTTSRDTWTSSN